MIYIVAYRLRRKNARRKICMKMNFADDNFTTYKRANDNFVAFVRMKGDSDKKQYELLTGDWKHVRYYEKGLDKTD